MQKRPSTSSPMHYSCPFSKYVTIYMWIYFWDLGTISFTYMLVLASILQSLSCFAFIFETLICSPNFFFSLNNELIILHLAGVTFQRHFDSVWLTLYKLMYMNITHMCMPQHLIKKNEAKNLKMNKEQYMRELEVGGRKDELCYNVKNKRKIG